MNERQHAAEVAAALGTMRKEYGPYQVAQAALKLIRLSRKANRWATLACNGVPYFSLEARQWLSRWEANDQARYDKAWQKIHAAIRLELIAFNYEDYELKTDPRAGRMIVVAYRDGKGQRVLSI